MKFQNQVAIAVASTFLLAGCAGNTPGKPSVNVTAPAGAAKSANAPKIIYVTDFYLPAGMIQAAPSVGEKVGLGGGPLSRLRQEAREIRGDDPESKARKLVKTLGETIAHELNAAGCKAEYRPSATGLRADFFPADAQLPKEGWLLGGWFDRVVEGNRAEEAVVGFGAGSGQVAIEIVVSDLAGDPRQPFLCIGSENGKKRMPGGIVAMNPYAMAAKFVLERGQTERDVKAMGSAIAKTLVKYIHDGGDSKPKS